jgi:hypothetical protein
VALVLGGEALRDPAMRYLRTPHRLGREYSVRYVEAKPWAVATITLLLAVVLPVLSQQLRQAQYIAVGIAEPSDFGCSARRRPDAEFILRQAIIAIKGDPFAP